MASCCGLGQRISAAKAARTTQDNDLIVIRNSSAAAKFDAHFERSWIRLSR